MPRRQPTEWASEETWTCPLGMSGSHQSVGRRTHSSHWCLNTAAGLCPPFASPTTDYKRMLVGRRGYGCGVLVRQIQLLLPHPFYTHAGVILHTQKWVSPSPPHATHTTDEYHTCRSPCSRLHKYDKTLVHVVQWVTPVADFYRHPGLSLWCTGVHRHRHSQLTHKHTATHMQLGHTWFPHKHT